jgi:hypothetical protein
MVRPGANRVVRKGWLGASYPPQHSMPASTTFFALSGNEFRAQYRRMILVSLSGIIFKQREFYFLGLTVNTSEARS